MRLNKFSAIIFLVVSFFAFASELSADYADTANAYREREASILSELLKEKNYTKPDSDAFRQKCLEHFGIDIQRDASNYIQCINGTTGCYDIYIKDALLATFGESVFYDPAMPGTPTVKDVNKRLRSKKDLPAKQFIAYNKLLFNDDYSVNGFFLQNESKDYLWEIVFRFDYEKNETLYAAAFSDIAIHQVKISTNQHLLLYNNPQRGYKKRLLNDFYLEKGISTIEQILDSTNNNWNNFQTVGYDINTELGEKKAIDQSLLDKALIHLLKLLSHHQSDEISLNESERAAYHYLIQFFDKDNDLERRLKLYNYYDMGLEMIPEEKRLVSTAHNDLLENRYVTQSGDGYINLRKEPSAQAEVIRQLPNQTHLIKMAAEGNWYYVQLIDSNIKGFIHNSQLLYWH